MNAKQMGWAVGVRVYIVQDRNRRHHKEFWATVVKVGREWVTVQPDGTDSDWAQERFHCENMQLHSGNFTSQGRAYASDDDYRATLTLNQEWSELVRRLSHQPPDHITLDDVRKIAAIVAPTGVDTAMPERRGEE